jgi:hypothetical protein
MATITLGNVGQPEAVEKGDNVLICHVSLSVSLSVGDVHIIGRLPHGAIPLDAVFYPGAALSNSILKFGTSASQELFFASASYSILARTTRNNLCTRAQISLSDDAMPRYENVVMVGTATVSVGHVCDLVVYYKMPGQTL